MDIEVKKHMALLGLKVEDRISGIKGIVQSICFDLYGCIQACVHPGLDKEGKPRDSYWFDVNRLTLLSKKPVMAAPNFEYCGVARGERGAADKPTFNKT